MNRSFTKIISKVLLVSYIWLLCLPVFHFHPVSLNSSGLIVDSTNKATTVIDPFQNANSECSVTQLGSTPYLNDFISQQNEKILSSTGLIQYLCESTKSLQLIFDSNGLRAPPAIS
ncbi:MAG: hypothetical protein WCZ90_14130 [Melioribacteraceae bacterium]